MLPCVPRKILTGNENAFTFPRGGQYIRKLETMSRLHAGMFVVEEGHVLETARVGPWRFVGKMKDGWDKLSTVLHSRGLHESAENQGF